MCDLTLNIRKKTPRSSRWCSFPFGHILLSMLNFTHRSVIFLAIVDQRYERVRASRRECSRYRLRNYNDRTNDRSQLQNVLPYPARDWLKGLSQRLSVRILVNKQTVGEFLV